MSAGLVIDGEPAFRTRFANPYNAMLYTAITRRGTRVRELKFHRLITSPPDIVHLHWPELTFLSGHRRWRVAARLVVFYSLLRVARLRGTRLIWTAHNIDAHEERSTARLRRWCRRWWCANVDVVLALSTDGVEAVQKAFPELTQVPTFVTPHGHYRDEYDFPDRKRSREALGISDEQVVVAAVGQIRPYKNIPALIAAATEVNDPDVVLLIAGRPDSATTAEELTKQASDMPLLRLDLGFLTDEKMAAHLSAADLVVLPYRAIQNSGSAILALSADLPVVVPELGAMNELADSIGADWVHRYRGDFGPDVLAESLRWWREIPRGSSPDLSRLDWQPIADSTLAAYRYALDRPRVHRRHRNPNS